jgi:hypothetical protein
LNQDDFSYFVEIQYCWDAIYTVRLTERGDFPVPWTRRYTCKMGDIRLACSLRSTGTEQTVNIGLKESRPSLTHWDRSDGEYRVKREQTFSVPLGEIRRRV